MVLQWTAAGAVAVAAARLSLGQPASVLTVAQRDEWRSNVAAPSAAVSADGRYIAFASYAPLAPADTNRRCDIYVLDRLDGRVTLESVAVHGGASNVDSSHPGISGDGRWLVYETLSPSSGRSEVVLRNRLEESAIAIGRAPAGDSPADWSRAPVISGDGRFVAFVSAANPAPGRDADERGDNVYVFDVRTGMIQRASLGNDGTQPSYGSSAAPSVSSDGRYVAFASTALFDRAAMSHDAANASRRGPTSHVYVRDRHRHTTRRLNPGLGGHAAGGGAWDPALSGDGGYVAFVSAAANLVAADRNGLADVFVADLRTGHVELISRSARGGSGNGPSGRPSISADGRFVAFQSEASDLVCAGACTPATEDINLLWDVFLFDREARVMTRVSADADGGWMEGSAGPALDAAGDVVAFSSRHPIDSTDGKNDFDLFVRVAMRPPLRLPAGSAR